MHSEKEYLRKIRNLENRLYNFKEKSKCQSAEIKKLRADVRRITGGRNDWKGKYTNKKQEIRQLAVELKRKEKPPRHHYSLDLMKFCVMLRLIGKCSYRGISRILVVVNVCFNLKISKLPCANSVENWVSKMGYFLLQTPDNRLVEDDVCLIVDESAGVGSEKVLMILACPAKKSKEGPLDFKQTSVCYMRGQKSWTGEQIAQALKEVEASNRFKVRYVLSDEVSVMLSGSKLFEKPHVIDISHAMASCLRKTFKKDEGYTQFTKQVASYQAKAVNRSLSYLRPPKQRTKARFMNVKPVVDWARILLNKFDSLDNQEKKFFHELPINESTLKELTICLALAQSISLIIKTKGIAKNSIQRARRVIKKYMKMEGNIGVFSNHVDDYLVKYENFIAKSDCSFNACTDIIESLFGKYKAMTNNTPYMGLSMICLELPTYSVQQEDIESTLETALREIFVSDLIQWNHEKSTENQAAKRRKFFRKMKMVS